MARVAKGTLSREVIIDAALALVDEGGLEALSMRAIGASLGVHAMSLYNHVANKAALLDGLHERLILALEFDLAGLDWTEALRAAAGAYRKVALAHPQAFVLLATRPLATPAEISHIAPMLVVLEGSGFSIRQRLLAMNLFFTFLNGVLLAEVAPVPGHSDVPEPDSAAVYRAAAAADPNVPSTATAFAEIVELGMEEFAIAAWFDDAVELVLRGLQTMVPEAQD
jgi:AcrR family transcriptional regulator